MRRTQILFMFGLFASGLGPLAARAVAQSAPVPGSELTVYLATMGQGDAVWEKFGHNAIWIRDARTRTTIAYNYGMFDFRQDRFIPRLMKGRMLYSMDVSEADYQVMGYASVNRSVTVQRLNLTPAQRHALREFLEWNWLPQNRDYLYDYFRDNCSTRVRDALDRALGGALRSALEGVPTGTTFRSHSLRLTASSPPVYAGLMVGLGMPTDAEIDAWDEGFVPMELMRHVRSVQVTDDDGQTVPLVAEENLIVPSDRAEPPATPPNTFLIWLAAGAAIAASLVLLARRARTNRFARGSLALAIFFWCLVTGFFGSLLALLWLFTDHAAAYPNMNVLQMNPFDLLLAAAAPLAVVGSRSSRVARIAMPLAAFLAVLSLAGVLAYAIPPLRQSSTEVIALVLPVQAAIIWALYLVGVSGSSPAADGADQRATPAAV